MMKTTFLLLFICNSIAQAAKILAVLPTPAYGHFSFTNAVLKSLAKAGHEITIITAFPEISAKENYTSVIDISDGEIMRVGQSTPEDFSKMTIRDAFHLSTIGFPIYEKVINIKEIQKILKSKEKVFDVMFVEIILYERCYYWISKKLNIPVIELVTMRSWFVADWEISNPRHPVFVPIEMGKTANHKNFYNRLQNTLNYLETISLYYWYTMVKDSLSQFYQKYVNSHISFEDFMESKPSMVFVNSHFSYFPRPMNPNMIEIGGITLNEIQPLSKEIQTFLDGAKHGAILFTFGSVIRAAKLPKDKVRAFVEAFAEIPQRVIWKYEEPIADLSNNVMLMDWVPQQDILAHKNVKAFISHCGQGAIHESIHYGVPLISCPLFADQHVNANIFENLQISFHLEYETISKDSVLKVLNEVINNTKYYDNMQRFSYSFKDRPMIPQESVVYWTEYVIRHNGAPQSSVDDLNWFQYLLLDVICFFIAILCVFIYGIYFICRVLHSFILSYFGTKK